MYSKMALRAEARVRQVCRCGPVSGVQVTLTDKQGPVTSRHGRGSPLVNYQCSATLRAPGNARSASRFEPRPHRQPVPFFPVLAIGVP